MRKATIIKYKEEFLAWCKGDSVLLGAPTSMHDKALIWREVRDFSDWKPLDTVYVLNDSYSDYRKALAEGKIVEFKHPQVGYDEWEIVTPKHLFQSVVPGREYRIKPEEPKFKVGDWLIEIHSNSYAKVLEVFTQEIRVKLYDCNSIITTESTDFKLWKPQLGELVILKNKNDITSIIKYNGETNVYLFIGEITWLHKKD